MTREELNHDKQKKIVDEANREQRKKVVLLIFKIVIFLTIIFTLFYLYNTYISTAKIIVREERIVDNKIPQNFDGIKIVQFSDLHYGSNIFLDDLQKLVKLINSRNPDLVVFTGDLIDPSYTIKNKEKEKLIKTLSDINTTLGKYAISGDEDGEVISSIFNQSDFTFLENSYDLIFQSNDIPILIVGTSSMLKKKADINKAYSYFDSDTSNKDIYTISLIHEPDLTDEILNTYKSNLILAGHSHNGNIGISYIKKVEKIKGAQNYYDSFYAIKDTRLYVSSGIGTNGTGIRLFCHPSINFFRLSSK